jgi:hypothetical protein
MPIILSTDVIGTIIALTFCAIFGTATAVLLVIYRHVLRGTFANPERYRDENGLIDMTTWVATNPITNEAASSTPETQQ